MIKRDVRPDLILAEIMRVDREIQHITIKNTCVLFGGSFLLFYILLSIGIGHSPLSTYGGAFLIIVNVVTWFSWAYDFILLAPGQRYRLPPWDSFPRGLHDLDDESFLPFLQERHEFTQLRLFRRRRLETLLDTLIAWQIMLVSVYVIFALLMAL